MKHPRSKTLLAALALCAAGMAQAKPIAFADGVTFMHERDRNMVETQLFYAPAYWWSAGVSDGFMTSDDKSRRHEYGYLQGNLLLKRWNLPDAQANLFASAGAGNATGKDFSGTVAAQRYTLQGDYETRRVYASFKVDAHTSSKYFDRYDTLQLGWSPYAHDYDELAVWFVAQVKKYRGMDDKTEGGAFLRLFKGNIWVELGMNERRKSQMMLMINY